MIYTALRGNAQSEIGDYKHTLLWLYEFYLFSLCLRFVAGIDEGR